MGNLTTIPVAGRALFIPHRSRGCHVLPNLPKDCAKVAVTRSSKVVFLWETGLPTTTRRSRVCDCLGVVTMGCLGDSCLLDASAWWICSTLSFCFQRQNIAWLSVCVSEWAIRKMYAPHCFAVSKYPSKWHMMASQVWVIICQSEVDAWPCSPDYSKPE